MKKVLVYGLSGLVLVLLVCMTAAWFAVTASLPELDGSIVVAGIDSQATVVRDAQGIATISAANRQELAFATGFAHAQDRFFQMDLVRRQAAGELSALVGAAAIKLDKRMRFHRFRSRAQAVVAALPAADRELIERYTQGVNAGLGSLGARPFEYFLLRAEAQPWRVEDSILIVYAMYKQLNDDRASKDVRRGYAHDVLPREVFNWLYPDGSPWDAPLLGEPRPAVAVPAAGVFSLRNASADAPANKENGPFHLRGSNNWAVSGALTEDGRAIVSNDMHLFLRMPTIYYRVRLRIEGEDGIDVSGVSLPGTPFVIAGSNANVAWGFTNSYGDWTDAVVLRPGRTAGSYQTADGERAFEEYRETITVKGADPEHLLVRETIWGPVLDDVDYPHGEIAVSWLAHKLEAVNLNIIDLERAGSADAALDIATRMAIPPQNFVTGDAAGNIGWTIAGRIPLKSDFNAAIPADWSGGHGWQGWLEPERYPRIVNPPGGRIWTANSRVVDGEWLRLLGDGGYDLGARSKQIRDGLRDRARFRPEDMHAIQYDDRALFLTPWRNLLLDRLSDELIAGDADLKAYRDILEGWNARASADSTGYRLVRAFRLEAGSRLFHAIMQPVRERHGKDLKLRRSRQFETVMWPLLSERPQHMLPAGYDDWNDFFVDVIRENLRHIRSGRSGPLSERSWGEINQSGIRHPLSKSLPILSRWLDLPDEALGGDVDMPKVQGPGFGASERFSVSPGNEAQSLMSMPGGQSGHPLSPYYDSGHADWSQARLSPFLPGDAQHTLTLLPANR